MEKGRIISQFPCPAIPPAANLELSNGVSHEKLHEVALVGYSILLLSEHSFVVLAKKAMERTTSPFQLLLC